jgi:uncharacterized protein YuzE
MVKRVSYDKEFDILAVHKGFSNGERFKGNIEIGDLILDLSTKMRIRGIEILNAREYLKEFLKAVHTKKNVLENIKDIKFTAAVKGESITLAITIITEVEKRREEIPAKIAVPISEPIM